MSKKTKNLERRIKLFIVSAKIINISSDPPNTEDTIYNSYIIATNKRNAISKLNNMYQMADDIEVTNVEEVYSYSFQISDASYEIIEDVVLENMV